MLYHKSLSRLLAGAAFFPIVLLSGPVPLAAQEVSAASGKADDPPAETAGQKADYHKTQRGVPSEIVVSGILPTNLQDTLSGVGVLSGADLTDATRPSIGETLAHVPGVSSTSFGPSASRPVLRGLQGERVRLLTDGIGSIDVSNTSVDHAAVVNPLLADRIEVLRGPQSLLYGSSAIGGVVNVIDRRIPSAVPDEPVHIGAIFGYGSSAKERSTAASIDVPVSERWVLHADGSYLKTDDLKIGAYALTPELRKQALASAALPTDQGGDPLFARNAAVEGILPNTASKTWTAGAGIGYIADGGNMGVAYSHYDSTYGVPIRFATLPGEAQEAPVLSLVQNRLDARAEVDPSSGFIEKISLRYGYASYRHFELGQDGSIGTAFYNKGQEGRLEVTQAKQGVWSGAFGAQYFTRDFVVEGDEAFLPKSSTTQVGLFALQQLDFDRVKIEAGLRVEHTKLQAMPKAAQPQFFDGSRRFDTVSASIGALYNLGERWSIGLNLSDTTRAPAAEELFANGPHGGTEAYEIGNPDFTTEKARSVEAILHGAGPGYTFEASAYHTWFKDFIYDDRTGVIEDGLPVYQFRQAPARYYGFEIQGSLDLASIGSAQIAGDALADYTHAVIQTVGPAPRIPPFRVLAGLNVNTPNVDLRAEVERTSGQDRVASFETRTAGFTLVNAQATLRPWGTVWPLSIVFSANNIFDVNARRAASYLKDFAPLSGRDIRVSARLDF